MLVVYYKLQPLMVMGVGQGGGEISNSNWTSCHTIQGVIAQVISESDERKAQGRFETASAITL